jgi:hypothetical protein
VYKYTKMKLKCKVIEITEGFAKNYSIIRKPNSL